jgi:hypothetical protein
MFLFSSYFAGRLKALEVGCRFNARMPGSRETNGHDERFAFDLKEILFLPDYIALKSPRTVVGSSTGWEICDRVFLVSKKN